MNPLRDLIFHLCRLVLGGLFLYAGALKASDVLAFAGNVGAYQLLPYAANYLVAATLPYVEMIAGVLLLFNAHVRPSALLLGLLNLVFIVALASLIWRGLEIDCGCFSLDPTKEATSAHAALLRDLGLMVLILIVYRWVPESRDSRY